MILTYKAFCLINYFSNSNACRFRAVTKYVKMAIGKHFKSIENHLELSSFLASSFIFKMNL